MPRKDEHELQAVHNHEFINTFDIGRSSYLDWVVTAMFYESVHWIEAYLAGQGLHSSNHHQRAATMQQIDALRDDPDLTKDYGTLRTDSENARYWCYRHTSEEVSSEEVSSQLVPRIGRVRTTMKHLLS